MVAERRQRILRSRCAVRISRWAKCGIAYGRSVERQERVFLQFEIVESAEFHEEVVWMLAVSNWPAVGGFALLKEFWIASLRDRRRIQAEHAADGESARAQLSLGHRHEPVRRKEFVCATRGRLLDFIQKNFAVEHERPLPSLPHEHLRGCGDWLNIGARNGVVLHDVHE